MLRSFFGCTSNSVQSQIAPVSFQPGRYIEENEELNNIPIFGGHNTNADGLRQKPKNDTMSMSGKSMTSSTKRHAIEDELFLFVLDLRVDQTLILDLTRFLVDSEKSLSCYTFDNNNETLLNSVLVNILKCTILQKPISPVHSTTSSKNSERKANLLFACKCLVELINSYQEYPRNFDLSSPYNGNCFTSIEKALIVVDIFLVALINYVSLAANRKVVEDTLNMHVHELLLAMQRLGSFMSLSETVDTSKLLWAQTTARCCNLVSCIVHVLRTTVVPKVASVYLKNMADLCQVVHAVGSALTLVKTQLGSTSVPHYTCSVLYWDACYRVLLLLKGKSFQTAATTSGSFEGKPQSMDPRYFMLCSQLMSSLYASLPGSGELVQEVQRVINKDLSEFARHCVSPFGGGVLHDDEEDAVLADLLAAVLPLSKGKGSHCKILSVLEAPLATSEADSAEKVDISSSSVNKSASGLSFRLRYLLCGVSYLLKVSDFRKEFSSISSYSPSPSMLSLNVPNRASWVLAVSQCLLTVLSPNSTGALNAAHVVGLGPFLADLLLKIVFGSIDSLPAGDKTDVALWQLARQLGTFTELLKQKMRAIDGSGGGSQINFASSHTVTSVLSSSPMAWNLHTPKGPNTAGMAVVHHPQKELSSGAFSLSLDTPAKDPPSQQFLGPASSRLMVGSPTTVTLLQQAMAPHAVVRFEVGDLVDGMCVLANGSKRWFPGKILSLNTVNNTFSLLFNDGDVAENKSAEEIRHTKRRTASNASSVAPEPSVVKTVPSNEGVAALSARHFITPIKVSTSGLSQDLNSPDFFALSPFSEFNSKQNSFQSALLDASEPSPQFKELQSAIKAQQQAETEMSGHNSADTSQLEGTNAVPDSSEDVPHETQKIEMPRGMSIKSVLCDDDCDAEDDDCSQGSEEDRVYEIPSVFEGTRVVPHSVKARDDVPRMRFDDLNMTAALPQTMSGLSLSSTLVSNDPTFRAPNMSGRLQHPVSHRSMDGISHFSMHNKSAMRVSSGTSSVQDHSDEYSGATRLLSWRGDDTHRNSDRTSSRGFRPTGGPGDAHLLSQEFVLRRSLTNNTDKQSSGRDEHSAVGHLLDVDEQTLSALVQTYSTISALLLQRCIVDQASFLDCACCACGDLAAPASLASSLQSHGKAPGSFAASLKTPDSTNMLFNIREFLEVCRSSELTSSLAELCVQSGVASQRLCKLLNADYFRNCLPLHMETGGVKIGEGGFGSVYQVSCSCGGFKQYKNCLACYKTAVLSQAKASGVHHDISNTTRCVCWHSSHQCGANQRFAVKRIRRERSLYDNATILDLFNEISALETLSSNIGVCALEDFGVHGSEYWLVMESGGMDLLEWRMQAQSSNYQYLHRRTERDEKEISVRSARSATDRSISKQDLSLYLLLYVDILLIVRSVHEADVAHFDLKCNNFILRDDPRQCAPYMKLCHQQGKPSGILFLADFGEAVCRVSESRSHPVKGKCRGTILIQSPEMLCASDAATKPTLNSSQTSSFKGKLSSIHSLSANSSTGNLSQLGHGSSSNNLLQQSVQPKPKKQNSKKEFAPPDARSDIWSLGCVLFELLTCNHLFVERTWPDLFVALCMEQFSPVPIDSLSEDLKELHDDSLIFCLKKIIHSAMQQDAAARASITQLVSDVSMAVAMCGAHLVPPKTTARRNSHNVVESDAEDRKQVAKRYEALREEYSGLNFSHLHMGQGVFLALENSAELLEYFERHDTVQHTSREAYSLDPQDVNADVPLILTSIDTQLRESNLARTTSEISRSVAQRQMKLDGSLVWIRISSHSPGDLAASTARAKESHIFDKFMRRGTKVCATHHINLGGDDLDSVVGAVQRVLKKVLSQHSLFQTVVVVSVDSAKLNVTANASADLLDSDRVYFDKQSVSVGAAVCGLLTSTILNRTALATASEQTATLQTAVCLDRLVQLWRCLPWFESSCSQEVVDHIIRQTHLSKG